ncbi:MFS transporter [Sedimentitalea nanhaiensis]|uniref:Major Facilitator Superfamily protein n=1 Tax=Sedimentitalea nanhaiensis TaxID=999627 RepID=A0A1I7ECK6_9RHOB|nr:MFS transporter [Sedimentitalea nanhaiensis]SFU21602.1 Major Facilitator Superfamily protein [Sedimentitalea nanhaiensis]
MPDTTPPPFSILITLAVATLTASLGISVASVLLPTLTRSFSATISDVQWVVLAYLMSVTISIVSVGRLGDLFGHPRVLHCGLILFIAASILSARAPTLDVLVAGRALQGLGGAILIALSMSIAREFVPTEKLGTAMGLLGTTSAAGTALGPSLGGLLLTWGDWRMAFWLLAVFAAVTLVLSMIAITPPPRRPNTSFRELDIAGTLVLGGALAAYALATSGGTSGIPVPPGMLMIAAFAATALFAVVETRAASPLVPMALLQDRTTGTGFAMNWAIGTVMMSTLVVGPFFLAFSLGLNDALIGLVMAVGPVVAALSGVPAGRLTDRLGARRVMVIGLAQTVLGLLCLAFLPRYFGVGGYVAALIALTPAFQLFLAANNTAVMINAPKEQRGRLSGLLGLSRNLGLMTGASAMSSLFVALLGTGDAVLAPAADVAYAFSMTFAAAAVLALMTFGLALYSQVHRSAEASNRI